MHAILSLYFDFPQAANLLNKTCGEAFSGGRVLDKKYVNYARDIVIRHSKDYRMYLNQYVADSRKKNEVLDYTPYLESTMEGIFYASINEAMWNPFTDSAAASVPDPDRMTSEGSDPTVNRDSGENAVKFIDRICELKAHLDDTVAKAGRNLHTPTYAAILIAVAMQDKTLGNAETEDLYALDKSVKSYFAMAAKNQQFPKE